MVSHKPLNFLLKRVLIFILSLYLTLAKLFKVDFDPSKQVKDDYTKLNSLNDPLPDIEPDNRDYKQLLAKAKNNGKSIKPVQRQKPLTVKVNTCPKCSAPKKYFYSYGHDPEGYQKLQCKICKHQWAPEKPKPEKNHPTYRCPYCGYALSKEKERVNFTKFKCRNDDCSKWTKENSRYRYRAFDFELDELSPSEVDQAPVNLDNTHFSSFIISKAIDFYIGLGLSLRQTARAIKQGWNVSVSRQTIQNWIVSTAHKLAPEIDELELPLSGTVAVDETYIKVKGNWHYLFSAIDAENGCIIAQHLSKNRDAKGALTILKQVAEKYDYQNFTLVTDMAPIYKVAVHSVKAIWELEIDHKSVKGLFANDTQSDEKYRAYKNIIERFFGTYKAHYKRHKSFSSFEGAVAHINLFQAYFNYLKPHSSFGNSPPLEAKDSRGKPIEHWAQLINWINDQTS